MSRTKYIYAILPAIMLLFALEHFSMYASAFMLQLLPQGLIAYTLIKAWEDNTFSAPRIFAYLALCVASTALIEMHYGLYKYSYFDEPSPITCISIMMLFACSITAAKIYDARRGAEPILWRSPKLLWLLISLGFVFLAVDEKTLIHEGLDRFIMSLGYITPSNMTSRLDDFIVVGYMLGALCILWYYRKEILRSKRCIAMLGLGFVVGLIHSACDMAGRIDFISQFASDPADIALFLNLTHAGEELGKILAETCFFVGLLFALRDERACKRK